MAASLLDCPNLAQEIIRQLPSQDPRKGVGRLHPESEMAWVARYLQDRFLPAPVRSIETTESERPFELIRAADWINCHSQRLTDITDEDLLRLRLNLGGQAYNTRRTYWATVEAVVGLPKIKRNLHSERMDPDRVPNEDDVWKIAKDGSEIVGEWFGVSVLLGAFGALRAGELVALKRRNIGFTDEGGLWITVTAQHRRYSKRHSDDGEATGDYAPPKGCIAGPAAKRHCYVPSRVANEVRDYVEARSSNELLFLNSRRTAFNASTFRNAWRRVIQTLPEHHRLAEITPHSMRHAGMSMWLRNGVDLKLIQGWGGWYSLKVMLDTYAALLPGAEEDSIALLEGQWSPSSTHSFPSAFHRR